MIRIEKARYVSDYKLWLRFSDGAEGEVDLQNQLDGEVFEPLKDTKTFKTEVWQDGSKVDSFTGILQEAAAAEFIKLLEAGAAKASPVKCKADGASLTYTSGDSGRLQIPAPFTPCIFPQ